MGEASVYEAKLHAQPNASNRRLLAGPRRGVAAVPERRLRTGSYSKANDPKKKTPHKARFSTKQNKPIS